MQTMRGTELALGHKKPFWRWDSPFNPIELAETAQAATGESSQAKTRIEGGCSRKSGAPRKIGHLHIMGRAMEIKETPKEGTGKRSVSSVSGTAPFFLFRFIVEMRVTDTDRCVNAGNIGRERPTRGGLGGEARGEFRFPRSGI